MVFSGVDLFYNIIYTLFIWLIFSVCYFLFRYLRHVRQEQTRFRTLEPDFQELDENYNETPSNPSIFSSLLGMLQGNSSQMKLKLRLPTDLSHYKSCSTCGALSLKMEIQCDICGSKDFDSFSKQSK